MRQKDLLTPCTWGERVHSSDCAAETVQMLAERLQQGDGDAWRQLSTIWLQRATPYCKRWGVPEVDADDLAMQVLGDLWKKHEQIEPTLRLWGLMRHMLCCHVIDWLRHKQRQLPVEDNPEVLEDVDQSKLGGTDQPDPMATLINREEAAWIRRCISGLPSDQRGIVTLRLLENQSYEEIAVHLHTTAGVAKSRYHRALRLLRQRL